MSRGRYIRWVVDSGRSPDWLLREYRSKVQRVIHIRRILKNPRSKNRNTGRAHSPLAINIYKRSLPIRERDVQECRQAIRWLASRGLIRKAARSAWRLGLRLEKQTWLRCKLSYSFPESLHTLIPTPPLWDPTTVSRIEQGMGNCPPFRDHASHGNADYFDLIGNLFIESAIGQSIAEKPFLSWR